MKMKDQGSSKKNRSGGGGEELLHRKLESGAGKSAKAKSADVGAQGYHQADFGEDEEANYRIEDGYQQKDESPSRSENSNIHNIALHSVSGELYSGDPARHGHLGKADGPKVGGGGNEEE